MNRIYALLDKRLRPLSPPRIKAHYRPVSPATHDLLLEAESEFMDDIFGAEKAAPAAPDQVKVAPESVGPEKQRLPE